MTSLKSFLTLIDAAQNLSKLTKFRAKARLTVHISKQKASQCLKQWRH